MGYSLPHGSRYLDIAPCGVRSAAAGRAGVVVCGGSRGAAGGAGRAGASAAQRRRRARATTPACIHGLGGGMEARTSFFAIVDIVRPVEGVRGGGFVRGRTCCLSELGARRRCALLCCSWLNVAAPPGGRAAGGSSRTDRSLPGGHSAALCSRATALVLGAAPLSKGGVDGALLLGAAPSAKRGRAVDARRALPSARLAPPMAGSQQCASAQIHRLAPAAPQNVCWSAHVEAGASATLSVSTQGFAAYRKSTVEAVESLRRGGHERPGLRSEHCYRDCKLAHCYTSEPQQVNPRGVGPARWRAARRRAAACRRRRSVRRRAGQAPGEREGAP